MGLISLHPVMKQIIFSDRVYHEASALLDIYEW